MRNLRCRHAELSPSHTFFSVHTQNCESTYDLWFSRFTQQGRYLAVVSTKCCTRSVFVISLSLKYVDLFQLVLTPHFAWGWGVRKSAIQRLLTLYAHTPARSNSIKNPNIHVGTPRPFCQLRNVFCLKQSNGFRAQSRVKHLFFPVTQGGVQWADEIHVMFHELVRAEPNAA